MHWPVKKLGDVASVFNGKTPSRDEQRESGHPVLKIKDVDERGFFKGVFESFVDGALAAAYSEKAVKRGDTLILNAAHNADYVGSKQFYARSEVDGALATGEWCIVRANQDVLDKQYASFFLQSSQARHEIRKLVKGIHLYPKDVARLQISLPPLATQKHIARVLEQADQLRKQAQQMESELNKLAQSLFLETFGDPRVNNRHLPKIALGEIIKLKSGEFLPATDMCSSGGIPVYGGNGVSGYHDKALFETPKIVIGRVGAYCGAVHRTGAPCWITDNALYVESTIADINSTYLEHALRMANLNQYSSQSGQPLVSGSRIYPVEILFPSLVEQEKFEIAMMEIERRKLDAEHLLQEKTALFNALMQRAFNGELTAPERKAA